MPDITRPVAEQLTFNSTVTGSWVLDDYLEACERGGRTLPAILADIVNSSGLVRSDLVAFRLDAGTRQLESSTAGGAWTGTGAFFSRYMGDWATGVAYRISDYVRNAGVLYLCVTDHTSAGSFNVAYFVDFISAPAISAVGALTPAADRLAYYTGSNAASLATLTAYARTLLDDADAAAARATLGLGVLATASTAAMPALTMSSTLTLAGAPSTANEASNRGYVDTQIATRQPLLGYTPLDRAGDSMTNFLTLHADPASALHAATRQYVLNTAAAYLPLAGGTVTGLLAVSPSAAGTLLTLGDSATGRNLLEAGGVRISVGQILAPSRREVTTVGDNFDIGTRDANALTFITNSTPRYAISTTGTHTLAAPSSGAQLTGQSAVTATPQNTFQNTNPVNANFIYNAVNDVGATVGFLHYGSAAPGYGALVASGAACYTNSAVGLTLMADSPGGAIRFAAGGNVEQMRLSESGNLGIGMTPGQALDITRSGNAGALAQIMNVSAGTAAYAAFRPRNVVNGTQYAHMGGSYTAAGPLLPDGGLVYGEGVGGIALVAANAAGSIRFAAGGTVEMLSLTAGGRLVATRANTTATDRHLDLVNPSAVGQESLGFTINGTERAALRADYVGNLSYVANGGYHAWYTGGDVGAGTVRLGLTGDGRLYGTALHNNAGSMAGTTEQYVGSGTWTPVFSNVSNFTYVNGAVGRWLRVGNVVTASAFCFGSISGAGSASFDITIPPLVPSALGVSGALSGTCAAEYFGDIFYGGVVNISGAARVSGVSTSSISSGSFAVHFTYLVT